ncbi:NAD(P)H-dependent flavin oxidoreductase [Chloroflexota bacterium]
MVRFSACYPGSDCLIVSNKLPKLQIGDLVARLPIIQGGMGVGISLSGLASAVAEEGGIGVISATGIGMLEPDFASDCKAANERALRREIKIARRKTSGIIGVNILVALTDFDDLLRVAVEEEVDMVVLGAGLPLRVPEEVFDSSGRKTVKVAPVVSSGRAADLIFRYWSRNYRHIPDALIVEGPLAGGHLGFKSDQITDPAYSLEKIFPDVLAAVAPYAREYGKEIPVIAAGGIYTGGDIRKMLSLGASGVQMGTRFVTTDECDASDEFKQAYINCRNEDIVIINSPVGLPGRAIRNQFLDDVVAGTKHPFTCPWKCLKTCDYTAAPYCISLALTRAKNGQIDRGFAFAGANAWRAENIFSVRDVFNNLVEEYNSDVESFSGTDIR